MDEIDKKILSILQKNVTVPLSELSKKVGISTTPCWNRIKKMEEEKIILSKVAVLNSTKINLPLTAFLSISIPNHTQQWLDKFNNVIKKYDQIIETHRVTGTSDYLLKIVSPSMEEYDNFQQLLINEIQCTNMRTSFSQKEIISPATSISSVFSKPSIPGELLTSKTSGPLLLLRMSIPATESPNALAALMAMALSFLDIVVVSAIPP